MYLKVAFKKSVYDGSAAEYTDGGVTLNQVVLSAIDENKTKIAAGNDKTVIFNGSLTELESMIEHAQRTNTNYVNIRARCKGAVAPEVRGVNDGRNKRPLIPSASH